MSDRLDYEKIYEESSVTESLESLSNISNSDQDIGNFRVFVGYDCREPIATYVCIHSLQKHASHILPISILRLDKLQDTLHRDKHEKQSTEFAFSRFLVPYLSDFQGISLFVDSDFLFKGDIFELINNIDRTKAVSVVKHEYEPRSDTKFLGQKQTRYQRKNWSSFMIFNNEKCKSLTPTLVNNATGLFLHRFKWLSDHDIGEVDLSWNYLVGEYPSQAKKPINAMHFTIGGPYFREFKHSDFAEDWFETFDEMRQPLE